MLRHSLLALAVLLASLSFAAASSRHFPSSSSSSPAPTAADWRLDNAYVAVTFSNDTGGLSSFHLLEQPSSSSSASAIPILLDELSVTLNSTMDVQCRSVQSARSTRTSVTFVVRCQPSLLALHVVYTLEAEWRFVRKHVTLVNTSAEGAEATTVASLSQRLSFAVDAFAETAVMANSNWQPNKDHAIFLRTAVAAGSLALFASCQSPFCSFSTAADAQLSVTATQPVGVALVNAYGEAFTTDGFVVGAYVLSPHWHLLPPASSPSSSSSSSSTFQSSPRPSALSAVPERPNSLNFAERVAFSDCVERFWVGPPRRSSLRLNVGWDENDYEVDISTAQGVEQYRRILDRNAQLGITHLIFAPQNSAVSSRVNATDSWGWEEALWLTLGEHVRLGLWVPGRDAVPPSIQGLLDYAASRGVRLMAYVYPPLAFRADGDEAWLFGGDCCASLASVRFQRYLASTLIAFTQATGIGGMAFDYNGYGDGAHTTYSQWRGWHWILRQLREHFPDFAMDHRQIMHAEGPWSWLTGSYAEPLQGDENPGQRTEQQRTPAGGLTSSPSPYQPSPHLRSAQSVAASPLSLCCAQSRTACCCRRCTPTT